MVHAEPVKIKKLSRKRYVVFSVFCKQSFHALCKTDDGKDLPDNICTKTFLSTFSAVNSKSGVNAKDVGNIVFVCDACLTSYEHKYAADT